jgi:hypothetical protein
MPIPASYLVGIIIFFITGNFAGALLFAGIVDLSTSAYLFLAFLKYNPDDPRLQKKLSFYLLQPTIDEDYFDIDLSIQKTFIRGLFLCAGFFVSPFMAWFSIFFLKKDLFT